MLFFAYCGLPVPFVSFAFLLHNCHLLYFLEPDTSEKQDSEDVTVDESDDSDEDEEDVETSDTDDDEDFAEFRAKLQSMYKTILSHL